MNKGKAASLRTESAPGELVFFLEGRLDVDTTAELWGEAVGRLERESPARLLLEAGGVEYCDGAGIGLFLELCRRQHREGREVEIRELKPEFRQLLEMFDRPEFPEPAESRPRLIRMPEEVGRASLRVWEGIRVLIAFTGELVVALGAALANIKKIRWRDSLAIAEKAGVNALPIILLVSFLVGLIMAFQAAIPMRQFGAEIYVANLIGLSMLRELGPLMTAIVLAGRTGSAFAAELGTMKVNEEIDALTTMGLDPVRFLVVNRVLAAMAVTPLLTIFSDLLGVMGGSLVLLSLGYPLVTYLNQLLTAVSVVDFLGGLFKSIVFGFIVAGIGCLQGLQTRTGASAVGDSATRAVVAGIILIVIVDGIFSVIYYYLGI